MKTLLAFILFALSSLTYVNATDNKTIRISTKDTDLILQVGENGRLYQTYLGEKLLHEQDLQHFQWNIHAGSDGSVSKRGWEVYSGSGNEDFFEPAISITHHDGNPSTILYYVSSSDKAVEGGTETTILLRDDRYPVEVTLHYIAYPKENIIKTWSEIRHQEKKPVTLSSYASTMLYFNNSGYYLTEFSSDWAKEAQMSSQQLQFGKKVIDTKLGSRAAMHTHPFFEIGLDQPVNEHQGTVLMGTLGWTGNFRFTFEVDNVGNLRVIPAINPYASTYELKANEVFYLDDFLKLEKDFPNFHFHLALDRPDPAADAAGVKYTAGFVHQVMLNTYLKDHEAPEDIEYYMCGPGPMSKAVVAMLDSLGVEESSIMYDNFGG